MAERGAGQLPTVSATSASEGSASSAAPCRSPLIATEQAASSGVLVDLRDRGLHPDDPRCWWLHPDEHAASSARDADETSAAAEPERGQGGWVHRLARVLPFAPFRTARTACLAADDDGRETTTVGMHLQGTAGGPDASGGKAPEDIYVALPPSNSPEPSSVDRQPDDPLAWCSDVEGGDDDTGGSDLR